MFTVYVSFEFAPPQKKKHIQNTPLVGLLYTKSLINSNLMKSNAAGHRRPASIKPQVEVTERFQLIGGKIFSNHGSGTGRSKWKWHRVLLFGITDGNGLLTRRWDESKIVTLSSLATFNLRVHYIVNQLQISNSMIWVDYKSKASFFVCGWLLSSWTSQV